MEKIISNLLLASLLLSVWISPLVYKQTSPISPNLGINYSDANQLYSSTQVVTSTYTGSGGVPLLALARNNDRTYAAIVNDGTADIYIYLTNFASADAATSTVVANNGIRVNAGGGSYEILPENLYLGDIWVASTTAAQRVLVTEKTPIPS